MPDDRSPAKRRQTNASPAAAAPLPPMAHRLLTSGHVTADALPLAAAALPQTPTHCPYCALQCAMVVSGPDEAPRVEGDPTFPVNRGALCIKGWTSAGTLRHPDRLTRPLVRGARRASRPRHLGRGPRTDRGRHPRPPVAPWSRRRRRLRRRLAHQREGLPARQVRAGGAAHREHRLQRALLHVVRRRRPPIKAFGVDRGLPFPVADLAGAEVHPPRRRNPAETMPPLMQYFEAQRARGGAADRRRPATHADRASGEPSPATHARHGRRAGRRAPPHPDSRRADRPTAYIRERTEGFERGEAVAAAYWPERVERITGVPEADLVGPRACSAMRARR